MRISRELSRQDAERAAQSLRELLPNGEIPRVAVVLGSGWGDALPLQVAHERPLHGGVSGFEDLEPHPTHARRVRVGTVNGILVIALQGRIHLNDALPGTTEEGRIYAMTRLQVEMLYALGVRTFILTCAAGRLRPKGKPLIPVGSLVVMDGFVTGFAPAMPGFSGEFRTAEDLLIHEKEVLNAIKKGARNNPKVRVGGYLMVRGPFFEGRRYDKRVYANTGASVIGMSVLPEAAALAAASMGRESCRIVGLAFVSNDEKEVHSDEEIRRRAGESSVKLGGALERLIAYLDTNPQ